MIQYIKPKWEDVTCSVTESFKSTLQVADPGSELWIVIALYLSNDSGIGEIKGAIAGILQ